MATKHSCVQGASYAYDFSCDEIPTFDVNWGGSWAIVSSLDDVSDGNDIVTLASGTLAISGDTTKLEMRIAPADTQIIPVGSYILVVEVVNATIGFSNEIMQDDFDVTEQGISV